MALVVITGGARSGKSTAAEQLALEQQRTGARVTVAVFGHSADGDDSEYEERISRHRGRRPTSFATAEYSGPVAWGEMVATADLLLLDCLGTMLGRVMEEEWEPLAPAESLRDADAEQLPDGFEVACTERLDTIVAELVARTGDTIIVTNEVGEGVVPAFASGRLFRDLLGRANRTLVDRAEAAYLTVAGRLVDLSSLPRSASWPGD